MFAKLLKRCTKSLKIMIECISNKVLRMVLIETIDSYLGLWVGRHDGTVLWVVFKTSGSDRDKQEIFSIEPKFVKQYKTLLLNLHQMYPLSYLSQFRTYLY